MRIYHPPGRLYIWNLIWRRATEYPGRQWREHIGKTIPTIDTSLAVSSLMFSRHRLLQTQFGTRSTLPTNTRSYAPAYTAWSLRISAMRARFPLTPPLCCLRPLRPTWKLQHRIPHLFPRVEFQTPFCLCHFYLSHIRHTTTMAHMRAWAFGGTWASAAFFLT